MVFSQQEPPHASGVKFPRSYYSEYAYDEYSWLKTFNQRRPQYEALIAMLRKSSAASVADVCEIGCGVGMFSYALRMGFEDKVNLTVGDVSDYALQVTRSKVGNIPLTIVKSLDAQSIDLLADSQDVLVSLDVVEHLPEPEAFFHEAHRVLRSGGLLLFSTPNPESFGSRMKKASSNEENKQLLWFALHDESHINIRPMDLWRSVCIDSGFVRIVDGSDYLWDLPYFRRVPLWFQKIFFIGTRRLFCIFRPFLPWRLGENYFGIWRKI